MGPFFLQHLSAWGVWIYVLIFIGMILEGETIMFLSVYLAHQGYLKLPLVFLLIVSGVILGDVLWYELGRHLKKLSRLETWLIKLAKPLDQRLQKKPRLTLFLAKFTYGLHRAALVRAGTLKVRFALFFWIEVWASLAWITVISSIAYFSAVSLHLFEHYLKFAEIGVLVAVLLFFTIMHFISKMTERAIEEE